ncbi:hypothetical protein GN244_ATG21015 [Phytophthora infestans]|uniref:Uncharacterized protein n=1 Tax=Phytophthora infestans TaxID=4787 RepID=A0A833W2R1_PHYIN|nr:hypothetical protein GN244_ATG21015 [Phytophthora infestans]
MTTSPSMYMETVSLNDDAPSASSSSSNSTVLDVDSLESQFAQPSVLKASKDATASPEVVVPVSDSDDEQTNGSINGHNNSKNDAVVVEMNGHKDSNGSQPQHVLPHCAS